ncbi:MAG: hypothetical protein P0S95_07015 [Rhabdochlamydiaceae bacterium]|nr:hypothetical protein [Candidatus Amphrikana amoebophyrae]
MIIASALCESSLSSVLHAQSVYNGETTCPYLLKPLGMSVNLILAAGYQGAHGVSLVGRASYNLATFQGTDGIKAMVKSMLSVYQVFMLLAASVLTVIPTPSYLHGWDVVEVNSELAAPINDGTVKGLHGERKTSDFMLGVAHKFTDAAFSVAGDGERIKDNIIKGLKLDLDRKTTINVQIIKEDGEVGYLTYGKSPCDVNQAADAIYNGISRSVDKLYPKLALKEHLRRILILLSNTYQSGQAAMSNIMHKQMIPAELVNKGSPIYKAGVHFDIESKRFVIKGSFEQKWGKPEGEDKTYKIDFEHVNLFGEAPITLRSNIEELKTT